MNPILIIDTETTGLDCSKHSILEICAKLYDSNGTEIRKFHETIKHDNPHIDLGALKVNNIKPAQIRSLGNPEWKVVMDLLDFLMYIPKDTIIWGKNINFDIRFIEAMLANYNIENLGSLIGHNYLDVTALAVGLNQVGKLETKSFSLSNIAKALNIPIPTNLHTAEADVDLTKKVLDAMLNLIK